VIVASRLRVCAAGRPSLRGFSVGFGGGIGVGLGLDQCNRQFKNLQGSVKPHVAPKSDDTA
jgi:hypothetical protein